MPACDDRPEEAADELAPKGADEHRAHAPEQLLVDQVQVPRAERQLPEGFAVVLPPRDRQLTQPLATRHQPLEGVEGLCEGFVADGAKAAARLDREPHEVVPRTQERLHRLHHLLAQRHSPVAAHHPAHLGQVGMVRDALPPPEKTAR